jgi:hypothetical protein
MIGTILGHTRFVRKLGGGSLCIVCEAEDLRLGFCVVLKLIQKLPHEGCVLQTLCVDRSLCSG